MSKTPEEMAQQYISTIADTHSVKAACEKAFLAGYTAAKNIDNNLVIKDILKYVRKNSHHGFFKKDIKDKWTVGTFYVTEADQLINWLENYEYRYAKIEIKEER